MSDSDPADPYRAPQVQAPEFPQDDSLRWRIEDGSLWVQDGAVLPPICLFGSSDGGPTVRGWITLAWMSPMAWRAVIISELVALGVLFAIAMRGVYGALEFGRIVIATSIIMGVLFFLLFGWKKHRRRLRIFRVAGRRRFLRTLVFSLAAFGAYVMALSMMVHFEDVLKLGRLQQIGLSNTLMMAMIMAQTSGRMFLLPHATEVEGTWFRLASIHPRTIAELAQIQTRERVRVDDSSA
ncbi:hypothetical protein [Haloferula sp. BvORR071]|uniref:hypothetical protein n=1 Tax=Haloferula sp. BvORR071 TaxID=1396141 RepID=UPI00054D18C1|nr:hypothetical protein [Haloferula sp. BvORR071]